MEYKITLTQDEITEAVKSYYENQDGSVDLANAIVNFTLVDNGNKLAATLTVNP